jgi:type I restriction enzyme S subunit
MIADLKPYTEYKESDSRWLSTVPSHWGVQKLRTLIRSRNERNHPDLPLLSVAREKGVFVRSLTNADENHNVIPEDLTNYKVARSGCLVINKMKAWQGSMGIAPVDGIVSPAYYVYDLDISNRLFGQALLRSYPYVAHFGQASDGVRVGQWDLTISGMREIPVLIPPPAEQAAIVRFLDWSNGRLERAIRAKRKVIALLNEQKQAILHRAVTRGLDPSIPLKPSGIPWLGAIPEHWTLKRFKFLATINSGQVDPRNAEYRSHVLIAPNHIQSGSGRLLKQETAEVQGADSGKYLVRRGQVVYSKIRPNLRKATIAPCDCLCSADMYPIDPTTDDLSTDYLLLLLLSQPFTKFAVDTSMRVAMPKVNREALADCLMWYPGANEQSLILEFIAREGAPIDAAISRLEREIDLLREYRTRLVADVVTGKLDVRVAATRLPDEELLPDLAAADDEPVDLPIEEEPDA